MKHLYKESFDLLKTGDLVFYRPTKHTKTLNWVVDKIKTCLYRSPYVYVGILEKIGREYYVIGTHDILELLDRVLRERDVDIYRVTRDTNVRLEYDTENDTIEAHTYTFDGDFVAMKVREQLGKTPCWTNSLRFWIGRLFGYNQFSNDEQIMKVVNCATVLEYAFNEVGYDFCPRVSPNYATLDILSRSSLIDYLFTLRCNADQYQNQSISKGVQ